MRYLFSCVVVFCAFSIAAFANPLSLEGHFSQGGLVTGRTSAGAKVSLNGKMVDVSPSGLFVFGFGRNAADTAVIEIILPDGSRVSRVLKIKQRKYRTQRINGLPKEMVTPSAETLERIREEVRNIRKARSAFTMENHFKSGFIWPSKGRISGVYGSQRILNGQPRRPHLGVDIAAPSGSPVVAASSGRVTLAENDLYFTGGTIIIHHGHGLSTVYSHLSDLVVQKGDVVSRGDLIGKIGSTGRSTGPHLDWRVNWFQERLDPMLLVGPMLR